MKELTVWSHMHTDAELLHSSLSDVGCSRASCPECFVDHRI